MVYELLLIATHATACDVQEVKYQPRLRRDTTLESDVAGVSSESPSKNTSVIVRIVVRSVECPFRQKVFLTGLMELQAHLLDAARAQA